MIRTRMKLQELALVAMHRFGEVKKHTKTLYLHTGNKGETIQKDFTFYKSVPEEVPKERTKVPQMEIKQGFD